MLAFESWNEMIMDVNVNMSIVFLCLLTARQYTQFALQPSRPQEREKMCPPRPRTKWVCHPLVYINSVCSSHFQHMVAPAHCISFSSSFSKGHQTFPLRPLFQHWGTSNQILLVTYTCLSDIIDCITVDDIWNVHVHPSPSTVASPNSDLCSDICFTDFCSLPLSKSAVYEVRTSAVSATACHQGSTPRLNPCSSQFTSKT